MKISLKNYSGDEICGAAWLEQTHDDKVVAILDEPQDIGISDIYGNYVMAGDILKGKDRREHMVACSVLPSYPPDRWILLSACDDGDKDKTRFAREALDPRRPTYEGNGIVCRQFGGLPQIATVYDRGYTLTTGGCLTQETVRKARYQIVGSLFPIRDRELKKKVSNAISPYVGQLVVVDLEIQEKSNERAIVEAGTNVMSFTVRTTGKIESIRLPFGQVEIPADLTVDWGDGTPLSKAEKGSLTLLSHDYRNPGEYTITVMSDELDVTKPQVPGYDSFPRQTISVNTPLLHSGQREGMAYLFGDCARLTTIPVGLFDNCTEVTDFSCAFKGCKSLTTIPEGIFDHCTKATSFAGTFAECTSLTSIPAGIFYNCTKAQDFIKTFQDCKGVSSAVPELWDTPKWPKVRDKRYCFKNCTKAANYANIPKDWK